MRGNLSTKNSEEPLLVGIRLRPPQRRRTLPSAFRQLCAPAPGPMLFSDFMNGSAHETKPPLRVLLAESSALVREGLREMVADVPEVAIVGEAGSCAELQALLRSTEFDLVLLDLVLPFTDSFAALSGYKALRPHLRIIALSQFSSSVLERRCREAGADYIINKTSGLEQLVEVIRHFARRAAAGERSEPSRA